jgi:hypothetical protein
LGEDLSKSAIDPEVSLAIRMDRDYSITSVNSAGKTHAIIEDDVENLDDFIASCGFEYVDGTSDERVNMSDIPCLPRVLDALGTIMWPSMVQSASSTRRRSRPANLLALDAMDESGLAALLTAAHTDIEGSAGTDALERWLEEDETRSVDGSTDETQDNDAIRSWTSLDEAWDESVKTPSANNTGFEDDFTAFVSAPARLTLSPSAGTPVSRLSKWPEPSSSQPPEIILTSSSTPDFYTDSAATFDPTYNFDASRSPTPTSEGGFTPAHAGETLLSLANASGPEAAGGNTADAEDLDLPSHLEVRAVSALIFGNASLADAAVPNAISGVEGSAGSLGAEGEVDPAFDLSRVLASLENMREEISLIPDDEERRRAAARVALGLVYGLGLDNSA